MRFTVKIASGNELRESYLSTDVEWGRVRVRAGLFSWMELYLFFGWSDIG
jgi:hypothetical protein